MKYWGYAIAIAVAVFAAYWLFIWIRYATQRKQSRTWPVAPATVEGATVGFVSRGVGVRIPAVYFNYRYAANDRSHTGLFLVHGGSNMQLKTVKEESLRGALTRAWQNVSSKTGPRPVRRRSRST